MRILRITLASLIAIWLIAPHTSANIDSKNIMGMWLFDEGKGNTATDSSEQGNDGEIHGAKWVDGKFGKALEFDGVANWVEVPHSPTVGFKGGTSFTITLHFKGSKVGGALVGKNYEDTSQALPWYLLWDDGSRNQVTLYLRDSAGTSFRADGTTFVGDDKWHFIVGRADASTGTASLWVDGKMEGEIKFNEKDGYGTSEGVFHIGRHYDRYTTGIIDDVALFDIALDEEEMDSIMNEGVQTAADVEPVDKLTTTWSRIKRRTQR